MAKFFHLTKWRGKPKIEFTECEEPNDALPPQVFGFMEAKASMIINALLANGAASVLNLFHEVACRRLDETEQRQFWMLIDSLPSQTDSLSYCQTSEWNERPMIEFSSTANPGDEEEKKRFRFGAAKASRVIKAINANGLKAVVEGLAEVASSRVDKQKIENFISSLPVPVSSSTFEERIAARSSADAATWATSEVQVSPITAVSEALATLQLIEASLLQDRIPTHNARDALQKAAIAIKALVSPQ